MKRLHHLLPFFLSLIACNPTDPYSPQPTPEPVVNFNVNGTVRSAGKGLAGVVVSDGTIVCVTDDEGKFSFNSDKKHGYVFISLPSGYEATSNGVVPQFFQRFTKAREQAESFDFNLRPVDQSRYKMLFFGDMHLAARSTFDEAQQFRQFTRDVKTFIESSDDRVYAMTLGDMSWDIFWKSHSYDLRNYLNDMNVAFGESLPVFHTMGNHDNDSSFSDDFLAESTFKSIIGPTYYSFNVGGVHYIVLDDIEYREGSERSFYKDIPGEEALWLAKDLRYVSKDTPLVLTMHAPLYYSDGSVSLYNGYNGLIKYLAGYESTFVTGHTHIVYNVDRTDSPVSVYEYNSGAVCGAWWVSQSNSGIHIGPDGAPGGYRVMCVDGRTMNSYFKGSATDAGLQFRSYDRNCICLIPEKWTPNATESGKKAFLEAVGEYSKPSSANEVLINVWDYDPAWKIEVRENGRSLPVTRLYDVKDPLYLVCYEAYEYEHRYDDSINYPCGVTDHIFKVTASGPGTTLEIKVTDDEGRVYSETMNRPKAFRIETYR